MTAAELAGRLDAKRAGTGWQAKCPAHEDHTPSLSISEGRDGRALVKCHAGCAPEAIVAALGFELRDLFTDAGHSARREVATYVYQDEHGTPLFEVVRFDPKGFAQRRPSGDWGVNGVRRVPYRLPQLRAAIAAGKRVFVVEGEKDVAAVERAGFTATCNPGGAGKWRPEYTSEFQGADVVIVADQDAPGLAHADEVARALQRVAKRVALVEPAAGKDVSDHLAAGKMLAELRPCVAAGADSYIRAAPTEIRLHESSELLPTRTAGALIADASLAAGVQWIVPALLAPGSSTCLYGIGKGGKSTFAAYIMACVASGGLCLGEPVAPSDVLLIDLEQHVSLTRRKFAELNLTPEASDRIHIYNGPAFEDLRRLEATIRDKHAGVVVIDSLSRFLQLEDENDNAAITAAWEHFMTAVVRPTNVCSLTIHHDRKSGGEHGRGMRGGSAYLAAFDVAIHVKRDGEDEQDPRRRLASVSRYDEANRTLVVRREETGGYVVEGSATDVRRAEVLATFGPGEVFTIEEVSERLPEAKRRTLIADLDTLYKTEKLHREGKGVRGDKYRYALPVFVQSKHSRSGENARIDASTGNPSIVATIALPDSCKPESAPCTNRGDAWEPELPPTLQVTPLEGGLYLVDGGKEPHEVRVVNGAWSCDCADHTYRRRDCKHILAARHQAGA